MAEYNVRADNPYIKSKVHARSGHVAIAYKGMLLVWGGYKENTDGSHISEYHDTDEVWMYNPDSETWCKLPTKGDTPARNSGCCGVVLDDALYVYGGYHGSDNFSDGNSNQLHRLDLVTMTWELLLPVGVKPLPCDKLVGWTYRGKLYFFGGFGPPPFSPVPFQHTVDATTIDYNARGWNNQLLKYDPDNNSWEWPRVRGHMPSPRAAHAGDITGNKMYIFGGRFRNNRMNDLHCLDLDKMQWSGNIARPFEDNPEGRSWHSFTFISNDRAVIYGGFNQINEVLTDSWLLDVSSLQWKRYKLSFTKPRLWHKAQFMDTGELVIVGGHKDNILGVARKAHADGLIILSFRPKPLLKLCIEAAVRNQRQLGSEYPSLPRYLQDLLHRRMNQFEDNQC